MAHAARYHTPAPVVITTVAGNNGPLANLCDFERVIPIVSAIVNITAITGAGATITFNLDVSVDGVNWVTVATTTAMTTVSLQRLVASNIIEPFVRVSWPAPGGTTPSVTAAITILCN